jgi:hypothetical protein
MNARSTLTRRRSLEVLATSPFVNRGRYRRTLGSLAAVGRAKRRAVRLYDVSVFLKSQLEEVSAIAGPISDWSGKYRENHPAA